MAEPGPGQARWARAGHHRRAAGLGAGGRCACAVHGGRALALGCAIRVYQEAVQQHRAKNPLTARVIVNREWAWHFGQGIVATPDDFGARGEPPTHPELLDYLASRFIEDGWSIKKLNRRILLTRAYQMASGMNDADSLKDSKNAYLWHFNRRRLEAEEIRDSLLTVSGNLDTAPGGEQPFPPEMSWRYTQHTPFIGADAAYATNKRSVYLMQQRIRRQPFLELFDGADANAETGCGR